MSDKGSDKGAGNMKNEAPSCFFIFLESEVQVLKEPGKKRWKTQVFL